MIHFLLLSLENYTLLIIQERLVKIKFTPPILLYWTFKLGEWVILLLKFIVCLMRNNNKVWICEVHFPWQDCEMHLVVWSWLFSNSWKWEWVGVWQWAKSIKSHRKIIAKISIRKHCHFTRNSRGKIQKAILQKGLPFSSAVLSSELFYS